MTLFLVPLALAASALAAVVPLDAAHALAPTYNATVRPLVIWHGMGDSYQSEGMTNFADRVRELHPGIFVHLVSLADKNEDDQRAGFVRICLPRSSGQFRLILFLFSAPPLSPLL
jgi:hypothetical protein